VRPRGAGTGKTVKLPIMSTRAIPLAVLLLCSAGCGNTDGDSAAPPAESYRRLAGSGCVEDLRTGLTWEVKSDAPGLHDWRNTYSWYDPGETHGELDYRGVADGGRCAASRCDTSNFVEAVNAAGHCGFSDWRMPSRDELMSISDPGKGRSPPTANLDYFPFTQPEEYWTGNDYGTQYQSAWAWNFFYGHDRVDWKRAPKFVRLVRGAGRNLDRVKE